MDKQVEGKQVRALNSRLAMARHNIDCAESAASELGLKEVPKILTEIGKVIDRVGDIVSVQVFTKRVGAPKKELKIRRFEVVDRKGLTRHGRHLNFRVRFHIKKSSSHVHVNRWLSEGRIREVA